ncbi:hypothetical protein MARBORIA2_04350 [Methanobrevibacter arboriphilus]|jgi:hypothetical protein|uniref:Uncharacterized protein n=1 Tax=Methanobrevibacter arboriphilus TaxID=39441 RepID=A0ACA8R208_METAZ|nr:hypothetical protein [Methanobrevibacter arboriphilus]BBL61321.1 hypothetical protein MarbSA_03610 [Methanobrevibacter arboriphilus]GLI11345.1 hypothetical protein MARBORIA2_04350 [Methanobrevibacter arboriphilus]
MIDNVEELKNKAVDYKQEIKREGLSIVIGDSEENFRISGIGEKAVKIEKFIKYEDMIEALELGRDDSIEIAIKKVIEDFEPSEDKE